MAFLLSVFLFHCKAFSCRFIVTLPPALKYTLRVQQPGDLGFGLFDQLERLQPPLPPPFFFFKGIVDSVPLIVQPTRSHV